MPFDTKYAVVDCMNDQVWGPYDSEEEATADIILQANENGWTEVIEAGDFPFEKATTGLQCLALQSKTGRALYSEYPPVVHGEELNKDIEARTNWADRVAVEVHETGPDVVNADGFTEAELIEQAEHEISMAQYRELHNRLEDYTRWLITSGFMAPNAIAGPDGQGGYGDRSGWEDFLFEHVEAYLDEATEHEDRPPIDQIMHPVIETEEAEA